MPLKMYMWSNTLAISNIRRSLLCEFRGIAGILYSPLLIQRTSGVWKWVCCRIWSFGMVGRKIITNRPKTVPRSNCLSLRSVDICSFGIYMHKCIVNNQQILHFCAFKNYQLNFINSKICQGIFIFPCKICFLALFSCFENMAPKYHYIIPLKTIEQWTGIIVRLSYLHWRLWAKYRSTEGCSKLKSPETRQVQEILVSTLEHLQVPKWDRTRCPEE